MSNVFMGNDYLMMICICISFVVAISGHKLLQYRKSIDLQYQIAFNELEKRARQLDKDEKWLDAKTRQLEVREDRIKQREKELNFLA